jgi:hypothetical protein
MSRGELTRDRLLSPPLSILRFSLIANNNVPFQGTHIY